MQNPFIEIRSKSKMKISRVWVKKMERDMILVYKSTFITGDMDLFVFTGNKVGSESLRSKKRRNRRNRRKWVDISNILV